MCDLFHAELSSLQLLSEAHLPMEEPSLVDECRVGLQTLTRRYAFWQVGMETDGDVVSNEERETNTMMSDEKVL